MENMLQQQKQDKLSTGMTVLPIKLYWLLVFSERIDWRVGRNTTFLLLLLFSVCVWIMLSHGLWIFLVFSTIYEIIHNVARWKLQAEGADFNDSAMNRWAAKRRGSKRDPFESALTSEIHYIQSVTILLPLQLLWCLCEEEARPPIPSPFLYPCFS